MRQVLAHAPMSSPTITRRPSLSSPSSPIRRSSKVLPLEDLHIHDRGFKAQNPVSPTFGSPANTEIPDTSEELLDEFSGGSLGSMGSMHGASYNNRDAIGATPPRLRVVDQGATGRVLRLRDGSGITCGRLPFFLSSPLGGGVPPGGVLVEALDPECCAAHAGLVVGDVIYRVNGEDLVGPRAFLNMLLGSSDDSEVVLHVHGKTVRECFDKTEGKIGLTCECHSEALVNREGGRHVHSNHGVVISGLRADYVQGARHLRRPHITIGEWRVRRHA